MQADRLALEAGQEPLELPFLFRPQMDMEAIGELADILEPAL
jgi:hypothetical protein